MNPITSHYIALERSRDLRREAARVRRARSAAPVGQSPGDRVLRGAGRMLVAAGEALSRAGTPASALPVSGHRKSA